jgi:hypothetical protein
MTRCVDEVPTGRRAPFCCELLPGPSINRSQWDHADNTGRALRAWFGVREMIGTTDAGAEVVRVEPGNAAMPFEEGL